MTDRLLLRWLIGLVVTALLALPLWAVLSGRVASEHWPIRWLELEGDFQYLSAEQVRSVVTPHLETGFFALPLPRIQSAVEALPWVQRVELRKSWPDTLLIRVLEHRPVARHGSDHLVDASGQRFPVPGAAGLAGLPELTGAAERLPELLQLLATLQSDLAGTGRHLIALDLSPRGSLTLILDDGAEIHAGRRDSLGRTRAFLRLLPLLPAPPSNRLARADLRYGNGFAVLWRALPESPVPEPTPS